MTTTTEQAPMTLKEMEALFGDPDVLSVQLDMEFGDCMRGVVSDRGELINMCHLLVEQVGMQKYDHPIVKTYHFGEKPKLAGTTVIQLITTSNVDVHGFDDSRACEVTLNSCKAYDVAAVLAFLAEALDSSTYSWGLRVRRIPRAT